VYLNPKETESQTLPNLIGGLWQQLILGKAIPSDLCRLYRAHSEKHTWPSPDELHRILQSTIAQYSKVYFIIDALDEYLEDQRNVLMKHVAILVPGVNLLITSRPHINLNLVLQDIQILEIHATEQDIGQYIAAHISNSSRLSRHVQARPELQSEIESKITRSAEGM
jgi:hypothetical protein